MQLCYSLTPEMKETLKMANNCRVTQQKKLQLNAVTARKAVILPVFSTIVQKVLYIGNVILT